MTNIANTEETIVAISTPNGKGAISIIRISGNNAYNTALKMTKKSSFVVNMATLSKVHSFDDKLIDEVIVIYFQNPKSFTGEDIIEIQCHGGIAVTNYILETILKYDVRVANAGEFSKRAYLNGKIDLTKVEAISKLIDAKSKDAINILARQIKGELKFYIDDIKKDLIYMLSHCEVTIDYGTEDLPQDIYDNIRLKIQNTLDKLENTLNASKSRVMIFEGFKLAIIGKPNVGKSSLLNKLLNFNRAIVSNIAGTTRDTIEEDINIGSQIVKIIDTAGIRKSDDEIEKIGIEKTMQTIEDADIILTLFDSSDVANDDDKKILNLVENESENKHIVYVLNKIDLENKFDKSVLPKNCNIVEISAQNNIDILTKKLEETINIDEGKYDDTVLVSNMQMQSVTDTVDELKQALMTFDDGNLEFFAFHINESLKYISNITRPYEYSNMLDVMFGEFCLGK